LDCFEGADEGSVRSLRGRLRMECSHIIGKFLCNESLAPLAADLDRSGARLHRNQIGVGVLLLVLVIFGVFAYPAWIKPKSGSGRRLGSASTQPPASVDGKMQRRQEARLSTKLPAVETTKNEPAHAAPLGRPVATKDEDIGQLKAGGVPKEIADSRLVALGVHIGEALDEVLSQLPSLSDKKKLSIKNEGVQTFLALTVIQGGQTFLDERKKNANLAIPAAFGREGVHQAAENLRKLAESGNTFAALVLAEVLFDGKGGLNKNAGAAFEWARKAAEAGNPYGYYQMSQFYYQGIGQPLNYSEAVRCATVAADHDVPESQLSLGDLYGRGQSFVVKDLVRAYMLLSLAATNPRFASDGDAQRKVAAQRRDEVAREMTPQQMQTAQRETSEWARTKRKLLPRFKFEGGAADAQDVVGPLAGVLLESFAPSALLPWPGFAADHAEMPFSGESRRRLKKGDPFWTHLSFIRIGRCPHERSHESGGGTPPEDDRPARGRTAGDRRKACANRVRRKSTGGKEKQSVLDLRERGT
jgi:hypothetical protein